MRIFPCYVLLVLVPVLPVQAQFLPFYPAPERFSPSAPPGKTQLVPSNPSQKPCPQGTSPNARVGGRCLPNQKGRSSLENIDDGSIPVPPSADSAPAAVTPVVPESNSSVSPAPTGTPTPSAKDMQLQKVVAEAKEVCAQYPGSIPSPFVGGYACIPAK